MMTLAEKILAAHSGKKKVSAGDFINCKVDLVMATALKPTIGKRILAEVEYV